MKYSQLENDVAGQLFRVLKPLGVDVFIFPETESALKKLAGNCWCTVCFKKEDPKPPKSTGKMAQDVTAFVEVIIQSKSLRGEMGIYTIVEFVEKRLMGYRPKGYSKIWSAGLTFVSHDTKDNLFQFSYMFCAERQIMEEAQDEVYPGLEMPVLITDITVQEV